MARLLICMVTLGLTVAFLSCKSDGLNDDGTKKDAGPTATGGGGSNLTSNTIHGDGIFYSSSSGGDTRASSSIHGDGFSAPVGGTTRATTTTYIPWDGRPGTSGGYTGTSSSRTMQGDGILPTGGLAGYFPTTHFDGGFPPKGGTGGKSTTSSIFIGGHMDGFLPVGGSVGTGDDTGGFLPVGGSGGKSSRRTIQGDGIYPPVGGNAGAVGGSTIIHRT